MKIHKTNSWLELNELYEDSKFIDKPYYVERQEKDKEIVWFGLETNWKTINGTWHILNKGNWEESNQPKYEEIYLKVCGFDSRHSHYLYLLLLNVFLWK